MNSINLKKLLFSIISIHMYARYEMTKILKPTYQSANATALSPFLAAD
jgi:hypothetical protein